MIIGSEGALGIITEAWMRLQDRPSYRGGTAVLFGDFLKAADAVRVICQAALYPANVRLLDAREAQNNGFGDGRQSVVVLAFENNDHPVGPWLDRALEICRDFGGSFEEETARSDEGHRAGAAGAWRHAFIRMPYWQKTIIEMGVITDTFETAITWERLPAFYAAVIAATEEAAHDVTGQPGSVSCRFTHSYPDGPAPYFSFQAKGRHGALAEQWLAIKSRAFDAVIANGGTVTHHHAVGRDHMPWYNRQRPDLFADALAGAKNRLDPKWILNPGVLLPTPG
jgi:alkyldihydroxyacetonephosphate synthase